jgi:hypothetical protein
MLQKDRPLRSLKYRILLIPKKPANWRNEAEARLDDLELQRCALSGSC